MCGIVGYIGPKKVVPVIIEGLRKLEYRGYDSAGIAVVDKGRQSWKFAAPPESFATLKKSSPSRPSKAPTASATRAGPPTAAPRKKMRTRIATAPARSSWCTTESSKIISS